MATLGTSATNNGQVEANAIMKQAAGKAPVHTFDADATPQEKAAIAGKNRDQLKSVTERETQAREVNLQPASSEPVVPTIVVEDLDDKKHVKATHTEQVAQEVQDEAALVPGALPSKRAPLIPDWYLVGWRQMSGIDKPPLPEGEERDKSVLDAFLSEQFYGAWYHNAAVIVSAVIVTHFLTRFNFGWGWLFIVLAFCNTYYSTSMERMRRNARDDIQRELVKTRLASEHETADWINNFLDRFWLMYEPILSTTIVSSVEQVLTTNTPAFLDSLRLTQFTLGTKAPRIDKVRTFPNTDEDIVMMDWAFSFTPCDRSQMTQQQIHNQSSPKIVLSIRVGKGLATAALPILVEDITFKGLMRIRMKLMANFPHVQVVDLCFLEKPTIDYVLKPLGGDTFGFDIANLPGLSTFIREMTHATMGPMLYDPNVFTLNLEQMLSGKPLDAAIGVIEVVVRAARGIKGVKIGGGTPDPFVTLTINSRAVLAKTEYKLNTFNPTWMETKYILIHSLSDVLNLNLLDFNDHRKNTPLGSTSFELAKLKEDSTQEDLVSPILLDGKDRGELRYDVNYYPVVEPEEGEEELLDSTVGIVRLTIHQAKELDHSKSLSGELNPLTRVYLNGATSSSFSTICFKHTNNPVWEAPYEYLCTDKEHGTVTIKVIDDRDFLKDPVVGYMSIKIIDLLEAKGQAGRDWFPLSGCKSGRVRLSADWKPLAMAGALHGSDSYKPPIGVVRLVVDKAVDVKNVEATLGGKSDPYVRVMVRNVTKGRTEVVNNNLNPVWDQIIYIPVHSLKETLTLECMDYQNLTKDRSLGSVELHVSDLAVESDEDPRYLYKSNGVKSVADPILLDTVYTHKGTLYYTAEFIPAVALKYIKFDVEDSQAHKLASSQRHHEHGGYASSDESNSSDEEDVPPGLTIVSDKQPGHKKAQVSVDTTKTTETAAPQDSKTAKESEAANGNGIDGSNESTKEKSKEERGIEMSDEELLTYQSGIVVFHIVSGRLSRKARLEVLLDDGYWPSFTTPKARSTNAQWGYVGEGFIKEVDFGRVWFRLNQADEGDKDDVIAEFKGDIKAFLQAALTAPQTFTLKNGEDRAASSVMVEARYIPVPVKLEPRETVNNQGILRVDLMDGHEIRGVDRGGKSDPYAVFILNGQKVFKSQTKKKTVSPEWNEQFEIPVTSRVGSEFLVEVFDWNQLEQAKSLGIAKIDLTDIEPFEAVERKVHLTSAKHGEKGLIRLRMVFQPEIIAKSRKNTSTFTSAGRAMTQIGGLPVSAGRGVFHGVADIFRRGGDHHQDEAPVVPDVPSGQTSQPVSSSKHMDAGLASFPSSENGHSSPHEPGTLRVTVVDAKDLAHQDIKPYATVKLGDKEFKTKYTGKTGTPEWNESFVFAASPLTSKLHVCIHDHKTLGKDKEVAEGEVDIWHHIKPEGISSADVFVELRQGGLLRLRLEFDAATNPNHGQENSHSSGEPATRTMSIVTPSRFHLRGRRPTEQDDNQSIRS